jgi:aldehyde dehydrogenase (NAD+)
MKFDGFHYTGNATIGTEVLTQAGANLVPTMLDLESKCPVIIDQSADVRSAAQLIAQTTFMNGGCIPYNPDYIMCHQSVADEFERRLVEAVNITWGEDVSKNAQNTITAFPKVINAKTFKRLQSYLNENKANIVRQFGEPNESQRFFPPVIMKKCAPKSKIMNEPVIGPILVLQVYQTAEDLCEFINSRELKGSTAQYFFGEENSPIVRALLDKTQTGIFIMNDTFLPF